MDGKDAPDCLTVRIISGKPEAITGVIPVTSGEKTWPFLLFCFHSSYDGTVEHILA